MKKIEKIKKDERGSITVLVLSSLIIILVVLLNLYLSGNDKITSQKKEIEKIQEMYSADEYEMETAYSQANNEI